MMTSFQSLCMLFAIHAIHFIYFVDALKLRCKVLSFSSIINHTKHNYCFTNTDILTELFIVLFK